jgi:glycosyltransferase involved in cell wall biosynthesis
MRRVVSVVIPTRDRLDLLQEAIGSVLSQGDVEWECIVVDDAGRDAVPPHPDPRVRVVRNPSPRGPGGARNTGIAQARGEYIVFLDDDDRLADGALRALLRHARHGVITFGQWAVLGSETVDTPHDISGYRRGSLIDDPPPLWTGIYPRATCEEFDESFRTGEDVEFLFRMSHTHRLQSIPELCYRYRKHAGDRVGIRPRTRLDNRLRLIEKHQAWYARHPSQHAHQLARAASAAFIANEYGASLRLAAASMRRRPNVLALKLLAKSLGARARSGWSPRKP